MKASAKFQGGKPRVKLTEFRRNSVVRCFRCDRRFRSQAGWLIVTDEKDRFVGCECPQCLEKALQRYEFFY